MKKIILLTVINFIASVSFSQQSIFDIINRDDLPYEQVVQMAEQYFKTTGTGQGSGIKHYERWKFERKFHIDDNGYYIKPAVEQAQYLTALQNMPQQLSPLATYTELGPWSWTYTSGWNPGVGRLTSVAVYAADTTIIYVSSPGGGIWKSINSGTTWQQLTDNNSSYMNVFHLAIDPTNSNIVYAALTSGGVIKTVNGGATWSGTGSGPSGTRKVLIDPTDTNIVFATSGNGVHKSINGGSSWTLVHATAKEDIEFKPGDVNVMYTSGTGSATVDAVYRSVDAGNTWNPVTVANGITDFGRTLLGVSEADPEVVYAVQASGSAFGRMYRSNNSGATFITTVIGSTGSGTNYFGYTGTTAGGQATYDMGIAVNPGDANEVHIAGIICWRSINGGNTFAQMTVWSYPNSTGYNHADVHGLEWINKTLYSNSDGGIFKSTDNADNWINLSTGLGIRQLYRLATAKTDANVLSAGAQDNGTVARTTTGTWRDWLGADGMECIIDPNNAQVMIGTSQYGVIYKTTNGGNSRSGLTRPAAGNWVTPIAWHPTNSMVVYGGWDSIYRSTNAGGSWTNISTTLATGGNLDNLKIAPSNDNYIYASRGSNLFVTTDGGTNWITYTSTVTGGTISSIEVKYNDPAKVWITTTSSTNSVRVSTNAGASFTNINTGLPAMAARSVVVDDTPNEGIYVGMNIGVYYKDNTANLTWAPIATGLPLVAINEIEISKLADKLRVATYGRGIWEAPLVNGIALPVRWVLFEGERFSAAVNKLHWKTEGHNSDVTFTVQRSKDGAAFKDLKTLPASTATGGSYYFTDTDAGTGNSYYRIVSVENGKKIYSSTIVIKGDKQASNITVLQNPVSQTLRFSIALPVMKDFIYSIYNSNGMLLYASKTNTALNEVNMPGLPSGMYIVEVNIDGILYRERFIKK